MRELGIIASAIASIVLFFTAIALGVALLPILVGVAILIGAGTLGNRKARRVRRN